MNKTLLVIGNGYDLQCGLKSSFIDYINRLTNNIEEIKRLNKYRKDALNKEYRIPYSLKLMLCEQTSSLSFLIWVIFIFSSNMETWFDIEGALFRFLSRKDDERNKLEKSVDQFIDFYNRAKKRPTQTVIFEDEKDFLAYNIPNFISVFLKASKDRERIIDKLYEILNKDLRTFESDFLKHLANELRGNEVYQQNSKSLFENLDIPQGSNVLSFNYTPFKHVKNVEYVHGTIESGSIIIGIDNTEIEYGNREYIFSKTYRKVESITDNKENPGVDVISEKYKEIIFYGHSLNKQDYAYFQTLFDNQNIYDGNTKLVFKYSVYNSGKKSEIVNSQISSVIALIESYGETLENRFKGKNLLHKLLNEKRLLIVEVPSIE